MAARRGQDGAVRDALGSSIVEDVRVPLQGIIETAFEAIAVTDGGGVIVEWNRRAEEILGWSRNEALGRAVDDLVVTPPSDEATAADLPVVRPSDTPLPNRRLELRARARDGSEFTAEFTVYSLDAEAAIGYLVVIRDLSSRDRAQRLLEHVTRSVSPALGEDFFRDTVRDLSTLLQVSHVLVGELVPDGHVVRTVAAAVDGELVDNFEYALAGTPCQNVIDQSTCCYPRDVRRLFPQDALLEDMGAESYLGTPLKSASGAVLGILVVMDRKPLGDVLVSRWALEIFAARAAAELQHRRAETKLRASEQQYRDLVENSLGMICTHDLAGNFLSVNPAAMKALGHPVGEFSGHSLREILAPSVRDQFDDYIRCLKEQGIATGFMRVVSATGEERVWAYRNILYHDPAGHPYVLGHAQDVTDLKRVEEALRHSEGNYRSLVEHAPLGIYRSSRDGRFLAVNPALVRMLGYDSRDELLGVDMARDLYLDPKERGRLVDQYQTSGAIADLEVDWRRKGGEHIRVRLNGRALLDASGNLRGFEMLAEDVTRHHALESQLRQSQKMEAVGQLTGGIAHDFNNILTAVLSNAELIGADLGTGQADLRSDVNEIRTAARRGAQMIKKLMTFSRRERLHFEDLDLPELCSEMTEMLHRLLPEHIDLQFAPEQAGSVRADRGAVEQILVNLATNARDAMPEGGVLRVEVRRAWVDDEFRNVHGWGAPGSYVCMSVSDTGVGMDEQTKGRVFEPFFTTKPSGEGTGLGMAMVYGLVKQHDGFISVYSEPGNGTTFRVYFPRAGQLQDIDPEAPDARRVVGGDETLLLAEDDDAIRRSATRILEKWGYRVLAVADGVEALEILKDRADEVDLVIADLIMPRLGGHRLCEIAQGTGRNTRFLFTSGYTAGDLRACGELDPTVPFLHKPWTVTELMTRVREALDQG